MPIICILPLFFVITELLRAHAKNIYIYYDAINMLKAKRKR